MRPRHPWGYVVLLLIVLSLTVSISQVFRGVATIGGAPLVDDAFYAMSVSRHLALGNGMTIDGVHATNGFQPLWVFLVAAGAKLVNSDLYAIVRVSMVLSTLCWTAFAFAIASLTRKLAEAQGSDGQAAWWYALVTAAASCSLFWEFHNGLETGLTLLALALSARAIVSPIATWREGFIAGAAFTLLAYSRLDTVGFIATYGFATAYGSLRQKRLDLRPYAPLLVSGLAIAPWLVMNQLRFGSIVPTSGQAESLWVPLSENVAATWRALRIWSFPLGSRLPEYDGLSHLTLSGIRYLSRGLALSSFILLGVALYGLLKSRKQSRGPVSLAWIALVGHCAFVVAYYTFAFGAPWFQARYLAPCVVFTIPICSLYLADLQKAGREWISWALMAYAAANVALTVLTVWHRHPWENTLFDDQLAYVKTHVEPSCTVGAGQSGTIGYFREHVVNLDGKVNKAALLAQRRYNIVGFLDESEVDVFVDWVCYADNMKLPESREFVLRESFGRFQVWVRRGRESCIGLSPEELLAAKAR